MTGSDIDMIRFCPFAPDDLGTGWEVVFGNWNVADGRLCHVLPGEPDPNAKIVISGSPGVEKLAHLGTVSYRLPGGGYERVHVTLEATIQDADSFFVALDDWAVEWAPDWGMRPALVDVISASRGHLCDDEPWGTTGATHTIELIGDPESVTFQCDGRKLFGVKRRIVRPYRKLMIDSYAGICVSNVSIEGHGAGPVRKPAQQLARPMLAATVDFLDDILYEPFTEELIDRLVERLHDLDIDRIYFHHTTRVRPEAYGPNADPRIKRQLDSWVWGVGDNGGESMGTTTIRNCYPFLPKFVDSAHRRGMQVYAVIKPFDMSVAHLSGDPSPFFNQHLFLTHPDASIERWPLEPAQAAAADAPVATIRFFKDDDRRHAITPEQINVWASNDNESYRRVETPLKISIKTQSKRFARLWEGDLTDERQVQTITIEGLRITEKYFAVTVAGDRACTFRNRAYRLAEVFDQGGRAVPTTRNMLEFPRDGETRWQGEGGFMFDGFATARQSTASWIGRDWIEMIQALDGIDRGIAFERGVRRQVPGAPDAAHPAVRQYWLDWVTEALDWGADGIDLRIINHHNPMDWANYGFSPYVKAEYERRFGTSLLPALGCRQQHAQMLGDIYTDFVRQAGDLVRRRGGRIQHHVSTPMDCPDDVRPMTGIRWDWQRWIKEGLVDAVTLKNIDTDTCFFDQVMALAEKHGVETVHCPYLNCIFCASDSWEEQLRDVVRNVSDKGIDALILYESASFLNANGKGDIVEVFPGLRDVLRP